LGTSGAGTWQQQEAGFGDSGAGTWREQQAGFGNPGAGTWHEQQQAGYGGQTWSAAGTWHEQQAGFGNQGAGQSRGTFEFAPRDTEAEGAGWDSGTGSGIGTGGSGSGIGTGDSGNGDSGDGSGTVGGGTGTPDSGNGSRGRAAGNGGTTAAHAWKRGDGARTRRHKRRRNFWRELPVLIVVALVLAVVIKTFAIQAFVIPSGSMENTLELWNRVLVNKIVYHLRPIHRGDIVVFDGTGSWDFDNPPASSNIFSKVVNDLEGVVGISHDTSIYIKRVVGLPGDHVACCNAKGQVTVNGVALSESSYLYPGNAPSTQSFHITVPAGRLWVMGDHRAISYDSRGHMGDPGGGTIPESAVLGRAFVIIWPPSRWGFLNIPATFEQPKLNASAAAGSNAAAGGSSAALLAAMDNGTPVRPVDSALPLALGFIGALPLTWLQRTIRLRRKARRTP
jgi:signal peptidase I